MIEGWIAGRLGRISDRLVRLAVFVELRLELMEERHLSILGYSKI